MEFWIRFLIVLMVSLGLDLSYPLIDSLCRAANGRLQKKRGLWRLLQSMVLLAQGLVIIPVAFTELPGLLLAKIKENKKLKGRLRNDEK